MFGKCREMKVGWECVKVGNFFLLLRASECVCGLGIHAGAELAEVAAHSPIRWKMAWKRKTAQNRGIWVLESIHMDTKAPRKSKSKNITKMAPNENVASR